MRIVLFLSALAPGRGLLETGEAVLQVKAAAFVALGFGPWYQRLRARDADPRSVGRHVTLPAVHPEQVLGGAHRRHPARGREGPRGDETDRRGERPGDGGRPARSRYRWEVEVRDYLALVNSLVPGPSAGPQIIPVAGDTVAGA